MNTVPSFCALLSSSLLAACAAAHAARADLPDFVVPDGLGVNIHFTDPRPGEMEMLAQAGFRWVRMDFAWSGTEREKGKYDFSAYDRLMAALARHKMRALLILDYANRHYDGGLSPASDEGRQAFARWAAAAAKHFAGRGILWEMYNEPNIGFWKPKPNVQHYTKLALEVGRALRAAAPEEMYIGPATSQIDLAFLEECFKAGLLEYWCAVSVHPYRQTAPETAAGEYARLRRLIDRYAPKGKRIPILSGEWGYSSVWKGMDEAKQGKMLPRQWLTNLANDVPLSIWYDWHDDGPDPKEPEHHFGTVLYPYHAGREPVYDPKPAYRAAKTLTAVLGGFAFNKRLALASEDDYVLLFAKGDQVRLAAWTTAAEPHRAVIPASPGRFQLTGHTGEPLSPLEADAKGLAITLTDAPQYLVPEAPNDLLRVAAAWQRAPLEVTYHDLDSLRVPLALGNPLTQPIRVAAESGTLELKPGQCLAVDAVFCRLFRAEEPVRRTAELDVQGMGKLVQTVRLRAAHPLRLEFGPPAGACLVARIGNPSGGPLRGQVRLSQVQGLPLREPAAEFAFPQGETSKDVRFLLADADVKTYQFAAALEDEAGRTLLELPLATRTLVDDFSRMTPDALASAWRILPDGDPKVASSQSIAVADPPAGAPIAGGKVVKVAYQFGSGWKFIRLAPQKESLKPIEGRPKALALWVYGDGSGNSPRLRFVDATGQTFQPSSDPITWKGWRWVSFPLDGTHSGHWGGADDGVVHYPIRWDSLFLVDGTRRPTDPCELYLASPVLIR